MCVHHTRRASRRRGHDGVDVHEESGGDDEIRSDEHHALQPVRLAVLHEEADEEDGEEEDARLERVEVEREGTVDEPRDHNAQRDHKERDL